MSHPLRFGHVLSAFSPRLVLILIETCSLRKTMTHTLKGANEQSDYLSFLLRLWRASGGEGSQCGAEATVWRASLQDTLTAERVNFASLEDLVAFLRRQMGLACDADQDERGSRA